VILAMMGMVGRFENGGLLRKSLARGLAGITYIAKRGR